MMNKHVDSPPNSRVNKYRNLPHSEKCAISSHAVVSTEEFKSDQHELPAPFQLPGIERSGLIENDHPCAPMLPGARHS